MTVISRGAGIKSVDMSECMTSVDIKVGNKGNL